jgi:methylated-DNA-[protein]-cysteine S-methyltransferase
MQEKLKVYVVESRLGPIYGAESRRGLITLVLPAHDLRYFGETLDRRAPGLETMAVEPQDTESGRQLLAYLRGELRKLDAPLDLNGVSDFSQAVLKELIRIPYGRTKSYGQVAAAVGRPKAARAVGRAVGANPVPIFVPCHRVVGANGALTGFGSGLPTKRMLLDLERVGQPLFD